MRAGQVDIVGPFTAFPLQFPTLFVSSLRSKVGTPVGVSLPGSWLKTPYTAEHELMKRSSIPPSGATKPARVPFLDRAPRISFLEEGPALRVPGASNGPARAGASLEPQGSTPSLFSSTLGAGGGHA